MVAQLLTAIHFAARKHQDQRRKGVEAAPYINHPIEVAEILARVGHINDGVTLMAAVLHDTIEDTRTTPAELTSAFGEEVCSVVLEVTDDKRLPKAERKELQVEHAPFISDRAKLVKLVDKITNVRAISEDPPMDWPLERKLEYFTWAEKVVLGLRGCSPELEALFDETVALGRASLAHVKAE